MPGPTLVAVGASRGGVLRDDEGPGEGSLHARFTALWGHTKCHSWLLWNVAPAGTAGQIRVETWGCSWLSGWERFSAQGFWCMYEQRDPSVLKGLQGGWSRIPKALISWTLGRSPSPDPLHLQQLPSFLPESLLSLHCLLIHPDPTQTALPPWSISDASWAWGWSILYAHRSLVCHGDGGTVAQRMGSILKELCTQNIYKDQPVWILGGVNTVTHLFFHSTHMIELCLGSRLNAQGWEFRQGPYCYGPDPHMTTEAGKGVSTGPSHINTLAFRKQCSAALATAASVSSWPACSISGKEVGFNSRLIARRNRICVWQREPQFPSYFYMLIPKKRLFLFYSCYRLDKNLLRDCNISLELTAGCIFFSGFLSIYFSKEKKCLFPNKMFVYWSVR